MSRNRFAALCVSAGLLMGGGGGLAAAGLLPGTAGAVGTTHKMVGIVNISDAVEHPRVSFSCNDVTLAWKFTINNVQVIRDDHVTLWPDFAVGVFGPEHAYSVVLKQNANNGLFGGSLHSPGDPSGPRWCEYGRTIEVVDEASTGNLYLVGTLN
jgi:hypothetical protein